MTCIDFGLADSSTALARPFSDPSPDCVDWEFHSTMCPVLEASGWPRALKRHGGESLFGEGCGTVAVYFKDG